MNRGTDQEGTMFYYQITVTTRRKNGNTTTTHMRRDYREFTKPQYIGDYVTSLYRDAANLPQSVTIKGINQRAYVRATRPGD